MTVSQIEKIEAFLGGKMDPEAQKSFARELETDKDFFAAFNTYRVIESQMVSNIQYSSESDLKNTLTGLNKAFFTTTSGTDNSVPENTLLAVNGNEKHISSSAIPSKKVFQLRNNRLWKYAAAIFLGIIATGVWYLVTNKKNTEEQQVISTAKTKNDSVAGYQSKVDTVSQMFNLPNLAVKDTENSKQIKSILNQLLHALFVQYFVPDNVPANKEETLAEAYKQYERKQYASAAATFEEAEADLGSRGEETDLDLAKFNTSYYKAICYMAIGKYKPAIRGLKQLSGSDSPIKTKAQWYLALAYLRIGDVKNAIFLLHTIQSDNTAGEYGSKAGKLLVELKSNN